MVPDLRNGRRYRKADRAYVHVGFSVVEIWEVNGGDLIILGSDRPWKSDPEVYQQVFAMDGPRRQLATLGLTSPRMILARQFASQRTGFAVAGPGPIQTDDFPVLEYAAPKAFFINHRARLLFQFDERTWQADLAPPEKSAALATLDDSNLKSIFGGDYSSANPDLQAFVKLRYEGTMPANYEPVGAGQSLSCVFAVPNAHAIKAPVAAATNEVVRQLFEAERALAGDPARQAEGLNQIQKILASAKPGDPQLAAWSTAYYANLATKASLRRGETQQAEKFCSADSSLNRIRNCSNTSNASRARRDSSAANERCGSGAAVKVGQSCCSLVSSYIALRLNSKGDRG